MKSYDIEKAKEKKPMRALVYIPEQAERRHDLARLR